MQMMRFYTVLVVFSTLFFTIFNLLNFSLPIYAQEESTVLKYDNTKFNFSIEYPDFWKLRETPTKSMDNLFNIEIISPFLDTHDMIQEKFLLSINKLPQNTTFEKYVDNALNQFNKTYDGFKLISDKPINKDGISSRSISYSYVAGLESMITKIVMTHQIFLINDRVFVLSFGTPPDKYYDYLAIVQDIFDSFSVIHANINNS